MKSKKVIFDTNIWISYLISDKFYFLDDLIETGKIKLIFSYELLEEFIDVAKRKKFKKFFTDDDIINLIEIIKEYGKLIKVQSNIKKCRDSNDDFLLNLAVDARADFLITGDRDLLVIQKISRTKIITIKEFLAEINN